MWLEAHEIADDEIEEQSLVKEKLDPEIRMNALRLSVELEMWDNAVVIGNNT